MSNTLIDSPRLVLLSIALLAIASCKPTHESAKKVQWAESQLDLPEMSPAEKKIADDRLEWNMETLYEAYNKIGSRNKKWDADARNAMKFFAQVRAYGSNIKGYPDLLAAYSGRAVELGCDDPIIYDFYTRFVKDRRGMSQMELAKMTAEVSDRTEASKYGSIRKFYAANRAVDNYLKIKPWPDEGNTYIDRAMHHCFSALADKSIPIGEIDDAGHEMLEIIQRCIDAKSRFDQMEALLLKHRPKSAVTYVLLAKFYVNYAWKGRSSKFAHEVTDEQWQMFNERLEIAEKWLRKGMAVDPKDGRLPTQMIQVVSAQSKGLPEMQYWWEKAMESDPNNFYACKQMIYYLLPRWYGSREEMIAFGRECTSSEKFGGTVPLALAEAHYTYNQYDGAPDGSYWLQPDVWPDMKTSYETFFERNPNATRWRSYYARCAWWCRQWDAFLEQVELCGDNVNYSIFDGREKFEELLKHARDHVAGAVNSTDKKTD